MIVYEMCKDIFIILVTAAVALFSFIVFDEAGFIFPNGIKKADGFDWGISFCLIFLIICISLIIGGTLTMIL